MTGVLAFIRDRFHPLHRARKSQWFSKYFLPLLDQVFAAELKDVNHRVYLKAITHSAYYLADASVEQAEKSMMLKVLEQLPPQSIFYDVGANIGLYAWLALSRRPDLKVHLFEPDPANLSLIRRTASENEWPSHTPRGRKRSQRFVDFQIRPHYFSDRVAGTRRVFFRKAF